MTSGRVGSAMIGAIVVASTFLASAPAHAAAEAPPVGSEGSRAIGLQEIFAWAYAFISSALGIV